jgi:hypothetical protein
LGVDSISYASGITGPGSWAASWRPGPGTGSLRQDLIDYVWLLDRFEFQILEEEKRKEALKPLEERQEFQSIAFQRRAKTKYEAPSGGELISVGFQPETG